jgi:hypothetical protein
MIVMTARCAAAVRVAGRVCLKRVDSHRGKRRLGIIVPVIISLVIKFHFRGRVRRWSLGLPHGQSASAGQLRAQHTRAAVGRTYDQQHP